jgi:hypothetical protein
MKKNVKAIIAALSASIMCAVPVAASFASTAATTSITAEAASDIIYDATFLLEKDGTIVITNDAITYQISGSEAILHGRYNPVSTVNMPDKIRYNGRVYKVTSVRAEAFRNAYRTPGGYGVTKFRCGKYVREIGDRAFMNSSLQDLDLHDADALVTIGNEAFAGASLNPTLYIPSRVQNIRYGAFRNNTRLKYVTIDGGYNYVTGENYNTIPVTFGNYAFAGTSSLRSFTIYRRYPKSVVNNGNGKDSSVLDRSSLTTDGVSGNVTGAPKFENLFFPHA